MKLTDGQHRGGQRRAARRDSDAFRSARRAGLLAAAVTLGGMTLPGATATAAGTGGRHSQPVLSDEAYVEGVAVLSTSSCAGTGTAGTWYAPPP